LVATVATFAAGSTIALEFDVLRHLGGGFINLKLQGLEVLCGVRTALDLGLVDLRIVRLNSPVHRLQPPSQSPSAKVTAC
jgi:hypothetical protein